MLVASKAFINDAPQQAKIKQSAAIVIVGGLGGTNFSSNKNMVLACFIYSINGQTTTSLCQKLSKPRSGLFLLYQHLNNVSMDAKTAAQLLGAAEKISELITDE
jgi:hypothetical protein